MDKLIFFKDYNKKVEHSLTILSQGLVLTQPKDMGTHY